MQGFARLARHAAENGPPDMFSDQTHVSSGPPIITTRRPKRSIIQPAGSVPIRLPTKKAVTTPLAAPKLTPNDFANAGIAGRAIPVPRASTNAGK